MKEDWINGRAFKWRLGEGDKENIKYAFKTLLKIGKAAGADKGILPMEPGVSVDLNSSDIDNFTKKFEEYPLEMKDLLLTTAHPQGGNMMTGDKSPHKSNRVVDNNFKVVGFDNIYVVDASIFPSGITVNPQWTIWALSSIAAKGVE
jgi:choline dehydrogenase-like flavoprotein